MTGRHPGESGSWDTEVLRRLVPSEPASPSPGGGRHVQSDSPVQPVEPVPAERQKPTDPVQPAETGASPWDSRLARRLAHRHGTPPWRRRLRVLAGVVRSDDGPERRTRATAQCQTAVSTGRRVAVVSAHGGAGGTTLTVGRRRTPSPRGRPKGVVSRLTGPTLPAALRLSRARFPSLGEDEARRLGGPGARLDEEALRVTWSLSPSLDGRQQSGESNPAVRLVSLLDGVRHHDSHRHAAAPGG